MLIFFAVFVCFSLIFPVAGNVEREAVPVLHRVVPVLVTSVTALTDLTALTALTALHISRPRARLHFVAGACVSYPVGMRITHLALNQFQSWSGFFDDGERESKRRATRRQKHLDEVLPERRFCCVCP